MMMGGGIILLIALAVLVVFLVQGGAGPRTRTQEDPRDGSSAREILAARFARGEISREEFEERTRVLERQSP